MSFFADPEQLPDELLPYDGKVSQLDTLNVLQIAVVCNPSTVDGRRSLVW